jgi:hypothetical protein
MRDAVQRDLATRGFAVVRATPELSPEEAARAPWAFAERLLGERPRLVERQPIKAVPGGLSFASGMGPAPLHTDSQLFAGTPPALQVMACVRPAARGGESLLADGWALLDRIAAGDPELYRLLFEAQRRIPFVFGDVFGPTVALRGGALVFTHAPRVPPGDLVASRLAPWIDAAPRVERGVGAREILLVDNHRMLHGRRAFDDEGREHVRLLVWTTPAGPAPRRHLATAEAAALAMSGRLAGAADPVRRRLGLGPEPSPVAARRMAVVLEMLRGVPPGLLSARERIPEPELYRMRDAALAAAERALAEEPLPAGDEEMARGLRGLMAPSDGVTATRKP